MKYKLHIFANTQYFWQNYVSHTRCNSSSKIRAFDLNTQQNIGTPKLAPQRRGLKNQALQQRKIA
jgi:hypothetical protein